MQKWEYLTLDVDFRGFIGQNELVVGDIYSDTTAMESLSFYGEQGWELVQILQVGKRLKAIFKREGPHGVRR